MYSPEREQTTWPEGHPDGQIPVGRPTKKERRWNYLCSLSLLIFFILIHALQAQMGIEALSFHSPLWVKIIVAVYALVNISVLITQAYLALRITRSLFTSPCARKKRTAPLWTIGEVLTTVVVTFGGQMIFRCYYLYYK